MRTSLWRAATLGLLLWATTWAQAAPNLVCQASAEAQGDTRRPVVVTVLVENRGNEPSTPAVLQLVMTPKIPKSSRNPNSNGAPSMQDPFQQSQQLPPVAPGQKATITFKTPYESKSSFRGQRGSFRAANIDPTGLDVSVEFQATIQQGAPGR